jgi:hypothetical protein
LARDIALNCDKRWFVVFTFEEEIELECITIEVARSSTKEHFIVAPAINRVQYPSKKTPNYGGKLASERMRRAAHKQALDYKGIAHRRQVLGPDYLVRAWRATAQGKLPILFRSGN